MIPLLFVKKNREQLNLIKRVLLFFILLTCISHATFAQETAIPDANFESFLEANGMGNGIAEDHLVTTANIENVTTLDLTASADIESLTGIEDFTALITLNCSSSNITTINLSELINLESLNCGKTDLIVLDLTANTSLKELYVNETALTELDLSQNTALTILQADTNLNLASLNVKNGNNINVTFIDTIDSPNLFCIVVDDPVYSEENWNLSSKIVFSDVDCALTAIPDNSFLEKLQIIPELAYSFTRTSVLTHKVAALTTLDISGIGITDLTGIEDFVGLQELTCINTSITNIDITQSTALTKLNVANNLLVDLDVTQNILLTELYCYSNALTTLEVSQNNLLEIFDCSSNQLTRLNLKNGNNGALNTSHLGENPNLTCIKVDDPITSNLNTTWLKDAQSNYELNCGETYVPDANFEQALIDLGYDTGALDNYVPTANINTLTNLDVSSKSIGRLIGIEDFVALTTLKASYNSFGTIDVSNLSQLVTLWAFSGSLTNLDVTTNRLLEDLRVENNQLDEINLTNNPLLRILQINNNNLEAIDVTNNTELTRIRTHYNPITELDLSNNASLEEIRAFQSQLTVLNIKNGNNDIITVFNATGNSNLTCIQVDDAFATILNSNSWYKDTQSFYSTDCRQTAIPDANFETYLETHNAAGAEVAIGDASSMGNGVDNDGFVTTEKIETVTTLSVSSKSIAKLVGIEDFTVLKELYCGSNSLDELDVSQNTQLTNLSCGLNQLKGLDVTQNTGLIRLSCYNNPLGSLDVTKNLLLGDLDCVRTGLNILDVTQNVALLELQCYQNGLTDLDVSKNILLEELECYENALTSLNMQNGNNANISNIEVYDNPDLYCIQVDDAFATILNSNSWYKDAQAYYSTDCRQTAISDANFETYLETHNAAGTEVAIGDASSMGNGVDNDGFVTTEKIEVLTSLTVINKGISSLIGIEDFIALEILNCNVNSLKELDVSKNTELTHLYCATNSLTNLDVTKNTKLIDLFCHENLIGDLDVTQNIFLEELNCMTNELKSLDLTQNSLLIDLYCYENEITSLDLSKNTVLKYLYCYDNKLNSLDISQSTLLKDIECNANELTNLDLSKNTVLVYLECSSNKLSGLDVSQNTTLNYVYCTDNLLSTLNLKNGNTVNTRLKVTGNPNLYCIQVDDIFESFRSSSKDVQAYYSTDCRQTAITDANFETYLETHNADGTLVDMGDATSMGNGVDNDGYVTTEKIETVTSLNVVRDNISSLIGIADFTALEELYCGTNSLEELDVSQNTQLTKLNCNENQLDRLDVTQNTALIELTCSSNTLDNLDVTQNIALTILDCSSNQIDNLDLTQNTLLTELECDSNKIVNLDVSQNIALTYFDCKNNQIISVDISQNIALNELYCNENALTSLNLKHGNNLNMSVMDAFGNTNLNCILVDDVSASILNSWGKDDTASFNDVSCGLLLSPKVFLQGAFLNPNTGEETLMRDDLRVGGYLSTNSPYNLDSIDATVLEVTGENAIVDWVSIGFRDLNDNTLLISDISGLLQRDGDIVDLDGISPLNHQLDVGEYYVSIKHRNHLEIVSAVTVSLSDRITSIDFTIDSTVTLGGTNAVIDTGNGIFAMLGGDYDTNGQVQNSDISSVILELGTSGYSKADMDMNGQVQNSDINNVLNPNIGKGQQF